MLAVLAACVACALTAPSALASFPYVPPGGDPHNPQTFKLPRGQVPTNLHDDYRYAATPEPSPQSTPNNQKQSELCGVRGGSIGDAATVQPANSCLAGQPVNTAWMTSTGRPDVTIAVLDSGIRWDDAGVMTEVRKKVRLNQGELPAPLHDRVPSLESGVSCASYVDATGGDYNAAGNYDVNNDGVFNVLDYACDHRVTITDPRRHGPANVLTPEDLIIAFSDGVDHDHNGYVNDIAGWDFVDNTNDPYDDVHYGHGSGEARDSTGEADTTGDVGTCPNCTLLPLRVGESFIADANRFAQAVLYGVDRGISVVQEALGTVNTSHLAADAISYAYDHGVAVIASAADEAAEHHNQPGALPHTIVVNSVTNYNIQFTPVPNSYLQFNGCTNFSTKVVVAVESSSCSSDATGRSAGVAGLIYSAALNARDAGTLTPNQNCRRVTGERCVLSANEVRQLMGSGAIGTSLPADTGDTHAQADDVNFAQQPEPSCTPVPQPTCTDPNRNMTFSAEQNGGAVVSPLAETHRYPARKGFDEFYGYGRLNAYEAVSAVAATPVATIPPEVEITSPQWFDKLDPRKATIAVDGHVDSRTAQYTCTAYVAPGGQPNNALASDTPPGDFRPISSDWCDGATARSGPHDGALGTIDVNDLKSRFPPTTSSFNGREPGLGAQTSNGRPNTMPYAFTIRVVVKASVPNGGPTMTGEDRRQLFLHRDQDMAAHFPLELRTDGDSPTLLADITGDNRNKLIIATSDGWIHAYQADGTELPGWPVHTDPLPLHAQRAFTSGGLDPNRYGAVLGALAAGDLFHDGRLEVVATDLEGKVYAWDGAGQQVFRQEANPNFSGHPLTPFVSERERGNAPDGSKHSSNRTDHSFYAGPVLADLDGDGRPEVIVAGADRHLYAWHTDGTPVGGFPVLIADPTKIQSIAPTSDALVLDPAKVPSILNQGKLVDTPAVGAIDSSGKPAIVVGSNEEYAINQGNEGGLNAGNLNTASLSVLGETGVLAYANSRLYAVKAEGKASGPPFLAGWPKKVGLVFSELLPDVGEGITGSPIVGPVTCAFGPTPGAPTPLKVGVIPGAGPGYVFNGDGSSCYGQSSNQDNALATDFAAGTAKYDTPAIPAAGEPAFGNLANNLTMLAPAAGVQRALDPAVKEYQGGQDFIAAWNTQSGQFQPGFPAPVNDLQFVTGPSVADVTGQPGEEAVGGTASLDLAAFNSAGAPASANWPKLTGDWTIAGPTIGSFGTLDTDSSAHKVIVSITRLGSLSVYDTPAGACSPSSWPRFHHDIANSGNYTRDAVPPGRPMNGSFSGNTLKFAAPGNDLLCGTASSYQAATSDSPITPQNFVAAQAISGLPAPQPAGTQETVTLPAGIGRYVAIRASDGAGNIGLPLVIDTGKTSPTGTGGGGASGAGGTGTDAGATGASGPGGSSSGGSGTPGSGSGGGATGGIPGLSSRALSPCLATQPQSLLSHRLARRRLRGGTTLHGVSIGTGCRPVAVRSVRLSVARVQAGGRCRFLRRSGRLSAPRSCSRPVYLRARVRPAGGWRVRWTLAVPRALPRGRYRAVVQATDVQGHLETRLRPTNRVMFHIGVR
jgi:hypothetical protein